MDEQIIKTKLDRLAEYHSQKDSIDAAKRAMLDEVKVPAEILALQADAAAKAKAIYYGEQNLIASLNAKCDMELEEIQIPDEIKAALAEIDRKRNLVNAYRRAKELEYNSTAMEKRAIIDSEMQAKTAQVYADLAQRKRDIEAEFAGKLDAVDANIKALEAEVKQDAKAHGSTVKGKYFSAIYVKGRVTWNTDMLDGMVALVPQLAAARKEGEPSITLRKA